jgi:hypothetical protein
MAIQLSDRDTMIFRFIEEHQVLLEKHIAWFISCDEKPVLIRDRLRKLFYLDYLLCERHGGKLPWWTTPTKPLVYMLSPMTRQLLRAGDSQLDISDCETQRHLLEVANLRMLFLMDQKEGLISDCNWTTIKKAKIDDSAMDACITFKRNGVTQKVGIINHPTVGGEAIAAIVEADSSCDSVWVICGGKQNCFHHAPRYLQMRCRQSEMAKRRGAIRKRHAGIRGGARLEQSRFRACDVEPWLVPMIEKIS